MLLITRKKPGLENRQNRKIAPRDVLAVPRVRKGAPVAKNKFEFIKIYNIYLVSRIFIRGFNILFIQFKRFAYKRRFPLC